MNNRKSIFDIESRIDIVKECANLINGLRTANVNPKGESTMSMYSYLDICFQDWPFRRGTSSVHQFIDTYIANGYSDEIKSIHTIEMYLNLLYWAPIHEEKEDDAFSDLFTNSRVTETSSNFIENIQYILEQRNMTYRKSTSGDYSQYIIGKRDAVVDSTIETIPELAEIILSYLDIRNYKDVEHKQYVLKRISDYMEPRRKQYKNTIYSRLCDDLFMVFNKCNIRHNKDQLNITKGKRIKLYDKAFRMSLILLQYDEIQVFSNDVAALKEKCETL